MGQSKSPSPEAGRRGMQSHLGVITSEDSEQPDEGPMLCSGSLEMLVKQESWLGSSAGVRKGRAE